MNRSKPEKVSSELDPNLFKIKESKDKGLADMETGSEVYMSELLVSIHNFVHLFCRPVSIWKTLMKQMNRMKKTSFFLATVSPKSLISKSTYSNNLKNLKIKRWDRHIYNTALTNS